MTRRQTNLQFSKRLPQLRVRTADSSVFSGRIALSVGSTLIGINYKQLQLQADFRYSLVHVRGNAEAIAFYQGEQKESDVVKEPMPKPYSFGRTECFDLDCSVRTS